MPQLPSPLRAAIGLVATAMDEARHLPDKAIELPMLAVSTALQLSLRAQQRYARLTARGDELLNRRETTDEPPPWATFDEPAGVAQLDLARDPDHTVVDPAVRTAADPAVHTAADPAVHTAVDPAVRTAADPAVRTAADPAVHTAADTAADTAAAPQPKPKPRAKPRPTAPSKTVRKPRNAKPSAFDAIGDE
jgi:hypothetical protein